jgi:peroxiredoxin
MKIFTAKNEVDNYSPTRYWNPLPNLVPSVVFHTRVRDESIGGSNPYRWQDVNSFELFGSKKVLVFSLPGAFTPTCSTFQLPNFEKLAPDFYGKGFDEIYCVSVNDSFVMNKWAAENNLEYVRVIPDGNGKFTEGMEMLVDKENLGFGRRSWRYACVVENGQVTTWFIEEGKEDNCGDDPYLYTNPEYILSNV